MGYRRSNHPAISEVSCPFCKQWRGQPCVIASPRIHTSIHVARVKKWEKECDVYDATVQGNLKYDRDNRVSKT